MFGWSLVRTSDLKAYKETTGIKDRVDEAYRWFADYEPLDTIWAHIFIPYKDISDVRKRFVFEAKKFDWKKPK